MRSRRANGADRAEDFGRKIAITPVREDDHHGAPARQAARCPKRSPQSGTRRDTAEDALAYGEVARGFEGVFV